MKFSKSWTRITLSAAVVVILAGCEQPETVVWVDLQQVADQLRGTAIADEEIAADARVVATVEKEGVLPEIPPSDRGREQTALRRNEALSLMETERTETLNKLEAAYRLELRAGAIGKANAEEEAFHERARKRIDDAIESISEWIREIAAERGRLAVRYTLAISRKARSGMPKSVSGADAAAKRLRAEVDSLLEQMARLDQELDRRITGLLTEVQTRNEAEKARLAESKQAQIRQADELARQKAEKRLMETGRLELPDLLDAGASSLPGQPERRLSLTPAEASLPTARKLRTLQLSEDVLSARLNIWLRLHGYKLADGRETGRDKTGEFLDWINTQRVGRFQSLPKSSAGS